MTRSIAIIALATHWSLFFLYFTSLPVMAQVNMVSDAPNAIVQVVEGISHACALTNNGHVLCWGASKYGLVGIVQDDQLVPLPIGGISETIESLSAGGYHTCGVTAQKHAICWGRNNYGVLGDEQTTEQTIVKVTTVTETIQMTALGNSHTCVLTTSGGVKCWGWNHGGELGNGDDSNSIKAVDVVGLSAGVSMITAGGTHTCALTTEKDVYCWGENQYGQLGNGEITEFQITPVKVQGLNGVRSIVAGGYHTCALINEQVKCWGNNEKGQLGEGTNVISSSIPVDVVGLSKVQEVAAYARHTCALLLDDGIRCWGYNNFGQLGDGSQISSNMPVTVTGLGGKVAALAQGGASNIYSIKYGGNFTCALLVDGNIQCWGLNLDGQLGNGLGGEHTGNAVNVKDLQGAITQIAVGGMHSCALNSMQMVQCWGNNESGQLGDGTFVERSTPVIVKGLSNKITAISAGDDYSCGVTIGGTLQCWGSNGNGALEIDASIKSSSVPITATGLISGVFTVATSSDNGAGAINGKTRHTCAGLDNGTIQCWGSNHHGELGDGTKLDRWQSMDVVGLPAGVTTVSVGYDFSCALLNNGTVNCWGANSSGQLGDGTFKDSVTPVQTVDLANPVLLATGNNHICAISAEGQAKCWGNTMFSDQSVTGASINQNIPTLITGLSGRTTDITAGYAHICTLQENGVIYCWGSNLYQQLGNSFQDFFSSKPVETQRFSTPPIQINGHGYHVCALLQNGQVWCWGSNLYGQLGNSGAWSTTPTYVASQRVYLPLIGR